ncbi:hypothetical protein RIR_jg5283.t1 [Rhizophagus irregularis DAOM 181602=DAOM 197198]|nr:hypothetical protein RIR_jg5283.t1 [Rhizophagus irregularis DAOM 181602=DAOM 197198]
MSQSMSEMDVYLGLLSMCLSSKESEKKMLSVLRLLVRNSKGDVSSKEALYRVREGLVVDIRWWCQGVHWEKSFYDVPPLSCLIFEHEKPPVLAAGLVCLVVYGWRPMFFGVLALVYYVKLYDLPAAATKFYFLVV